MDDWAAPSEGETVRRARRLLRPASVPDADSHRWSSCWPGARAPAIVTGAGAAADGWDALVALAERLGCPVWQEASGRGPGSRRIIRCTLGVLPADRPRLRAALAEHDVVLAVGAPVFRQYAYEPGPLVEPGTTIALVTDDPAEAHRSPAELAYLARPAEVCARLAAARPAQRTRTPARTILRPAASRAAPVTRRAVAGRAGAAGAGRAAARATWCSSRRRRQSRPDLHRLVPARNPLGFVSAAMGGLGFALPAAVGLRMALPDRPVVAVVGDGSALCGVQALWSAAHYRVGALFVVLANGRYAVMDRLAEQHGGKAPWPAFDEVSMAGMARALGCEAIRIDDHGELTAALDDVLPTLAARREPLLLDVSVSVDPNFQA